MLLPRIHRFIPAATIVEIAPGHGRWTRFLLPHAGRFIGVDLAESCVTACRRTFSGAGHASFEVADGRTLPGVEDGSADFIFSFDSLVHAESDVIEAYLHEFSRTLTPDGVAFVHHSNLGVWGPRSRAGFKHLFGRSFMRYIEWRFGRARSMTATRMQALTSSASLVCVGQEIVNWCGPWGIDCFTLVARPGSRWARGNVVVRNRHFMAEARSARALAKVRPAAGDA